MKITLPKRLAPDSPPTEIGPGGRRPNPAPGSCGASGVTDDGWRTAPGFCRGPLRAAPPPRLTAFTLLEVMIAIAIFAGILTAIYASWSGIVRGSHAALQATTDAQRARVAMRAFEEALTSALLFGANVRHYGFVVDQSDSFPVLSFVARLGESFPGSGMFGGMVVRRVTFKIEPDSAGGNHLVMIQTPLLAPPESDKESYPLTLARRVKTFELALWDMRRNDWVEDWPMTNQLPRAVRVLLEFGEPGGHGAKAEKVFAKTISIASLAVPPPYQMPPAGGPGQAPSGPLPPGGVPPGQPGGVLPPGPGTQPGYPPQQIPPGQRRPPNYNR